MTTDATQDPEAEAEAEAAEAEQLVAVLEERVRNGDESIRPEEIQAQESLGRFARLRVEAAKRKAAAEREKTRKKGLTALRKDIEGYADNEGERFESLLRDVEAAVAAFADATKERNDTITGWHQKMVDLGVEALTAARLAPSTEHAGLGFARAGEYIQVADRRIERIDGGPYIQRALWRVVTRPETRREDVFTEFIPGNPEAVYDDIRALDQAHATPRDGHFYRGPGGAVLHREEPYTAEEIHRLQLSKITAKEAYGE